MPRSLSVYIFYLKKVQILSENPGMEMIEVSKKIAKMYKTVSPANRQKYLQITVKERSYEEKLDHSKPVKVGPKKPSTPFALYFEGHTVEKIINPETHSSPSGTITS